MEEVERYRLDKVGLILTHSAGSGTQVLERGWTLSHAGVAGLSGGLSDRPKTLCLYVGVYSGRRKGCFPAPLSRGTGPDYCLCLHAKQQFSVPTLFGILGIGVG